MKFLRNFSELIIVLQSEIFDENLEEVCCV